MYTPREDSLFFKEFLRDYLSNRELDKNFSILDMGSGSGILAKTCLEFIPKGNIVCVDIQKNCVIGLREEGFASIHSDLFREVPRDKFYNLILFNAPYLPDDKNEDEQSKIETTGGKRGDEISLRFLRSAKVRLKQNGRILLLVSSLTPLDKLEKYNFKIVARKKIFFEELLILEFSKN